MTRAALILGLWLAACADAPADRPDPPLAPGSPPEAVERPAPSLPEPLAEPAFPPALAGSWVACDGHVLDESVQFDAEYGDVTTYLHSRPGRGGAARLSGDTLLIGDGRLPWDRLVLRIDGDVLTVDNSEGASVYARDAEACP